MNRKNREDKQMISFKNDYSEGALPEIIEALVNANLEQTVGYDMDEYCARDAGKKKLTGQVPRCIFW